LWGGGGPRRKTGDAAATVSMRDRDAIMLFFFWAALAFGLGIPMEPA
jgi:hypothetical protein